MTIEVLGPTRVPGTTGTLSPRDRVVLSALCLLPGEPVAPEVIADALWGDEPPKTWTKVVQGSVVRLRKVLGTSAIVTDDSGYRLALPAHEVDAVEFERLVARGRDFLVLHEPARAAVVLGQALSLWRGVPFVDLDAWDPARAEAARLTDVRRSVEEELLQARLEMGSAVQAAADAQALVTREPFRERRWGLLALALYRTGRQREALDVLRRARATLAEELGIDPGPELAALETRMLRQDAALLELPAGVVAASRTCPYRGLRPFDVDDADLFHGRSHLVSEALRRLDQAPLLVVAGPSGSGKSSLVRAGLVPAVVRARAAGQAQVAVVTPGPDPLASLAAATASGGPDGLLVVDQLEELFAQRTADAAGLFLDRLADLLETGRTLVVTLRADHLGGLADSARFARAAERAMLIVTPMSESELRRVIEEPARQAGLALEPGLVDLLLREVAGEAGALPLLSHALAETWEHRDGIVLTVDGYRATGGIRGAVAQSAERLYDALEIDDREALRSVLRRLVSATPAGDPVAAAVPIRVFLGTPDAPRLLDLLVRARLVTLTDNSVTLAHESLIGAWPRLRTWLDEDVEGQRLLAHLQATADGWQSAGRVDDELYRGARLAAALEWRERTHPVLSPTEDDFLAASAAREADEQARLAESLAHASRRNRQLRSALVAVATVLALALLAGALAIVNGRRADSVALDADARRLAAQSYAAADGPSAQLLAAAAYRLRDTIDTRSALLAALQRDDAVLYQVSTRFRGAWVGTSGDGATLLVMDNADEVSAFDPATRDMRPLYRMPVSSVAGMSPDGRWVVGCRAASEPDDLAAHPVIFDAATGRVARVLPTLTHELPGDLPCGAFSADGRFLVVAGSYDGVAADAVDVYDAGDWTAPPRRWRPDHPFSGLAVGTALIATRSTQGELTTASLPSLTTVAHQMRADATCSEVCPLSVSGDDELVALTDGGRHAPLQLSARALGGRPASAEGLASEVVRLAYSPDGRRLAAVGADGGLLVQSTPTTDAQTPVSVLRSRGDGSSITSLAWTGDRQRTRLFTVGSSAQLVAWNLSAAPRAVRIDGSASGDLTFAHVAGDRLVGIAPDGSSLFSLDVSSRQGPSWPVPSGLGEGQQNSWSADGSRVALTFLDAAARSWGYAVVDALTGQRLLTTTLPATAEQADRPDDMPAWALLTDDGRQLVIPTSRDRLTILDVGTGKPVREVRVHLNRPADDGLWLTPLRLGPDGSLLVQARASVSTDPPLVSGQRFPWRDRPPRRLLLVDPAGDVVGRATLASVQGIVQAPVSPDGTRVAVSTYDGTLQVFDARSLVASSPPVQAQRGWVMSVSWSPDGSMLLSSGLDGVLALWDGRTLNRVGPAALLGGAGRNGTTAWFAPDGHIFGVVQGVDGLPGSPLWFSMDGQPDRWLADVCSLVGRDMSSDEWSQYVGARDRLQVCPRPRN